MLPRPGLLLLAWCGIAATVVALPIARAGRAAHASRLPRSRRALGYALDLLLFPLLYALLLETLGRADIVSGAAIGAAHAAIAIAAGTSRTAPDTDHGARLRTFLARTLYGIVFAFLYIVPTP